MHEIFMLLNLDYAFWLFVLIKFLNFNSSTFIINYFVTHAVHSRNDFEFL